MSANTNLTRRKFLLLAGSASAITGAAVGLGFVPSLQAKQHWLISACSDNAGNHYAAAFDISGQLINKVKLPARGHDVIAHPNKAGHGIVFARRPGQYLIEIDFTTGNIVNQIAPQSGYHFYGHGIGNEQVIITTENNYHAGRGAIVVRDINNYQVLTQFDSGGIGPHELAFMPDKQSIVIANGGILTHPAQPRKKLNLATMQPNLAYMDIASGKVLDSYQLDNHQLSIRHLAVSEQGKVIAGLQYQGAKSDLVPLAIAHHGEDQLQYLQANEHTWRQMNHYTASICIDNQAQVVAISCPRADMLTYWSLSDNRFMAKERVADGAGLTFSDGLIATSGKGQVLKASDTGSSVFFDGIKFDNHLSHIEVG